MNNEQQIFEITETINEMYGCDAMYYGVDTYAIATYLYEKGYRKCETTAEVASEFNVVKLIEYLLEEINESQYVGDDIDEKLIEYGTKLGLNRAICYVKTILSESRKGGE